ncbi:DUF3800 domain-containing protein [bacterium]|nr:DUF3800 domain-containing protein [bacterium]
MYVDESGDPGLVGSQSRYFALSGLVLHELSWKPCLDQIIHFRRRLKQALGLPMTVEIHASVFMHGPPPPVNALQKHQRLQIIRNFADELAQLNTLTIINIIIDKSNKPTGFDVFEFAWKLLIQRLENTMAAANLHGPRNPSDKGFILPDSTNVKKLTQLIRKMRHINYIRSQPGYTHAARALPLQLIVEDPSTRDSKDSYFIQAADLCAYLFYQYFAPNRYFRRTGAFKYLERLKPVLCLPCSTKHPLGIVVY